MQDIRVHGSIFFLLKKFITKELPASSWYILNEKAGTASLSFSTTEIYPIRTMNLLLENAAEMTGLSRDLLMEQFGTYLVDDLFILYKDYIRPEWKTFDIILHTESVMHGAVRKLNSTANPPILNVFQVNEKLLIIDYFSQRRMAALAIGIIRGISAYYREADKVKITPMTNPDDERVQIRLWVIWLLFVKMWTKSLQASLII